MALWYCIYQGEQMDIYFYNVLLSLDASNDIAQIFSSSIGLFDLLWAL